MLVPPKPWLTPHSGGYLSINTSVMRTKGSHAQMELLHECDPTEVYAVRRAVCLSVLVDNVVAADLLNAISLTVQMSRVWMRSLPHAGSSTSSHCKLCMRRGSAAGVSQSCHRVRTYHCRRRPQTHRPSSVDSIRRRSNGSHSRTAICIRCAAICCTSYRYAVCGSVGSVFSIRCFCVLFCSFLFVGGR